MNTILDYCVNVLTFITQFIITTVNIWKIVIK